MKIMSLGFNCCMARFLTQVHNIDGSPVRKSSPMDWTCQCSPESILYFINGDVFRNVVNKRFTIVYSSKHEDITTIINNLDIELYHENLDDNNTFCKYITRLVHLSDAIKNKSMKFIYEVHPDATKSLVNKIIKYIGRDRLIIVENNKYTNLGLADICYAWDNDSYWTDNEVQDNVNKNLSIQLNRYLNENLLYKFNPGISITHDIKHDGTFIYKDKLYDNFARKYI